jgi:3',5'-cyclic-nucleotide phosphodiesterase
MELKVLGCFGRLTRTTAAPGFLLDDQLLIDGGTITSALSENEFSRVQWLLLSHAHLDHIKEIPFLMLSRCDLQAPPLVLSALHDVLETVRAHLFNDRIWPDFSRLGDPPSLIYRALEPGRAEMFGPYRVTAIELSHLVPCAGFVIEGPKAALAYVSDTRRTDALWPLIAANKKVKTVVVDISFPDRLAKHAEQTGHYTPSSAAADLRKIGRAVHVLVTHMHPHHVEEIRREVRDHGLDAELLAQGQVYLIP